MKTKSLFISILFLLLIYSCKQDDITSIADGVKLVVSTMEISDPTNVYKPLQESMIEVNYSESDQFSHSDSITVLDVTVTNSSEQKWQGIVKFDLKINSLKPWFLMPGFIYGDNISPVDQENEIHKYWPRLRTGEAEVPYSPFFRVRSDRLSYPFSAVHSNGHVHGISGSPYLVKEKDKIKCWYPDQEGDFIQFNGMGCELDSSEATVSFTVGYENAPWLYVAGKIIEPATPLKEGSFSLEPGETLDLKLFVYSFKAEDRRAFNFIIKNQVSLFHEEPRKVVSPRRGLEDLAEALFNDAYDPRAKNYATVTRLVDGKVVRDEGSFSIAWTGGMVVATPMLMASTRLDREDMRLQALECIQDIVDNSLNEKSGLPYDAKSNGEWTTSGWWEYYIWKPVEGVSAHSSYLAGQALFYILKAYELEIQFNDTRHEDWLDFVIKISNRIERTKNVDHEYPYRWSPETGEPIDYDAMGGAWCLATRAYLARILDDSTMLRQADESITHYWSKFVKQMNCYGTPHDVWMATEEEGVLAFVKAATILHRYTGDEKYLVYLRDGIDYEFTWKYCYNTKVLVPPLSNLNWSSSGSSGTSVANPHVHPMGNLIMDEILYYSRITGGNYYLKRAKDVYYWPLQSYNHVDGALDFGKKGWMSERHCPHQGLLIEEYPDGDPASIWFVYHSWASGCALESLCGDAWEADL